MFADNCQYFTHSHHVECGVITLRNPKAMKTEYENRYIKKYNKYGEEIQGDYIEESYEYGIPFEGDILISLGKNVMHQNVEIPDWVNKTREVAKEEAFEKLKKKAILIEEKNKLVKYRKRPFYYPKWVENIIEFTLFGV